MGARDGNAVLNVFAGDAYKVTRRAAGIRVELSGDGEDLGCVNGQSGAVVAMEVQDVSLSTSYHHNDVGMV